MESNIEMIRFDPHDEVSANLYFEIYNSLFPEWEREPEDLVIRRHKGNEYVTWMMKSGKSIVGFFTMTPVPKLQYTLLNYIAVAGSFQSFGYGSILFEEAKKRYTNNDPNIKYLIIEAEEKPSRFYQKRGAYLLDVNYKAPRFDGDLRLVKMDLLIYGKELADEVPRDVIHKIVFHCLTFGYWLDNNDPRIEKCFDWQQKKIRILK